MEVSLLLPIALRCCRSKNEQKLIKIAHLLLDDKLEKQRSKNVLRLQLACSTPATH